MYNRIKIICILSMMSGMLHALSTDKTKPLQINSNSAYLDNKNGIANLRGNIIITQGSMKVTAENGTVTQIHSKSRLVTLNKGKSQIKFSQSQDNGGTVTALCNDFNFDESFNLATLTGNVLLNKGKDIISGEKVTYNTVTQEYKVLADSNKINSAKDRVTIILNPKDKNAK